MQIKCRHDINDIHFMEQILEADLQSLELEEQSFWPEAALQSVTMKIYYNKENQSLIRL